MVNNNLSNVKMLILISRYCNNRVQRHTPSPETVELNMVVVSVEVVRKVGFKKKAIICFQM